MPVDQAVRSFRVHRSTVYRWKAQRGVLAEAKQKDDNGYYYVVDMQQG